MCQKHNIDGHHGSYFQLQCNIGLCNFIAGFCGRLNVYYVPVSSRNTCIYVLFNFRASAVDVTFFSLWRYFPQPLSTSGTASYKRVCVLYNCVLVYCRHARKLNRFHNNCMHRLLRITWQDMIPDMEVLKRAGLQSINALLKKAQLRWAGHIVRMSVERLPKRLLYGNLSQSRSFTNNTITRNL